jgi:hypothetical protein
MSVRFRRVGHQGRLRPVFDGAMAALLGRVPTAVMQHGGDRRRGHGATGHSAIAWSHQAPLPTLQIIDGVIE